MRILHTESSRTLGGREYAVMGIVEGLAERGHYVVLAVQPESDLQKMAHGRKLPIEVLRMSKLWWPSSIAACRKLIQRHGIEVVHTHSSQDRWIAGLAARFFRRPPIVILGRHHCGAIRDSLLNRLIYRRLSDCIVTTGGESLRAQLIEENGLSPSRVVAIPTGVDLARFSPDVDANGLRVELKITPDAFVVGSVCFLRDYKGLEYLIEAAGHVLPKAPRVRFLIVGDGPERKKLSALICQAGLTDSVSMIGHRDDIPRVMATLDLCVVCSTGTETLTQVIPQAFAMRKAVIATAVGGIPDIVINHVTGLLVPPRDAGHLAEAILWCIANKPEIEKLAQTGQRLVIERYGTDVTVDRTECLYRDRLTRRGVPRAGSES
jgi:glycosyltransferase involved in cell wall biosynthesis